MFPRTFLSSKAPPQSHISFQHPTPSHPIHSHTPPPPTHLPTPPLWPSSCPAPVTFFPPTPKAKLQRLGFHLYQAQALSAARSIHLLRRSSQSLRTLCYQPEKTPPQHAAPPLHLWPGSLRDPVLFPKHFSVHSLTYPFSATSFCSFDLYSWPTVLPPRTLLPVTALPLEDHLS